MGSDRVGAKSEFMAGNSVKGKIGLEKEQGIPEQDGGFGMSR
jgi:hypothetical protein